MPPSAEPVHKGTLVCVVLKARNLPNKKAIGKQDPYAVLSMGTDQQKTKPDKRGGQHPTWDEQLHFEIYEDMEDAITNSNASTNGSASKDAPPAPSKSKGGKKILKVQCYADDNKEPEFIGEGLVDLTDTLKTGEFDEWVTIKAKDRYAGEVFLELTFYSSAAPPKKRKPVAKTVLSPTDTYGGAGTFQRIDQAPDARSAGSASDAPARPPKGKGDHPPIPASMRPGGAAASHNRMSSSISASNLAGTLHRPPSSLSSSQTMYDLGSSTLRPSSSLANLDTYTPAYAPASVSRSTSPAPPPSSSSYHSLASPHSAGGSRRHSFAAPMPSEFGQNVTPSASYYSLTPPQSNHYLANTHAGDAADDMYATVKPGTIVQHQQPPQQYTVPRSQSISHYPSAYTQMPQPDYGADALTHSMSQMGFGHTVSPSTVTVDRPLPPPTPSQAEQRPPQSHIYQAPAHLASLYTPPEPQHMQRPVSPAARPSSALSHYSTSPAHVEPTQSVVNAQAYYQQQPPSQPPQQQPQPALHHGGHLAQPPVVPPRASSPSVPTMVPSSYTPIPSPYAQHAQQPQPQQPQQPQHPQQTQHVSRPLPSTQSSTSLASSAPAQHHPQSPAQYAYPPHLYHPMQQPTPPPQQTHQPQHSHTHSHSHSQSYSQSTWQGPPPQVSQPPPQQSYVVASSPAPSVSSIPSSVSSGYLYSPPPPSSGGIPGRAPSPLPPIPGQQLPQQLPTSSSMHGVYATSPAPALGTHYQQQPQQQHYAAPPQQQYAQQQYAPPPQQQQQQTYQQPSTGIPSSQSFSSSLLYQQYQHQHQQQQQ